MSALAAARLGYRCHILTREPDSPAAQVSAGVTISDYADPVSLRAFAAAVDVISFEFENVSAEGLDLLASLKPVRPSPAVLRISQDRVAEKCFLNAAGVATAPWAAVGDLCRIDRGGWSHRIAGGAENHAAMATTARVRRCCERRRTWRPGLHGWSRSR